MLVLLFSYFTFSVCVSQFIRFVTSPFVFTVEINFHSWIYSTPAITICADYVNETFIDESYQSYERKSIDSYEDFRRYMIIIGKLNAESIHLIDDFENTEIFKSLRGEDLLDIAINV